MIKIDSLEFENIKCFTEKQVVDFQNRDRLIQVDGINNNTNGSSGAGKSTIFHALDYLLGINDIPSTVLQSRFTKNPMSVTGNFTINKNKVIVKRSKKGGLSIKYLDNPEMNISGSNKLVEERLDELIGIPRPIFKKMVHKKQGEKGFFLSMTPKETYNFLVEMLGLNIYIEKTDVISNKIRDYEDIINLSNVKIQSLESQLIDLDSIKNSKIKPISPEINTNKLEKAIEKNNADLNTVTQLLANELSSIEEPEKEKTIDMADRLDTLTKEKGLLMLDFTYKRDKLVDDINNIKVKLQNIEVAKKLALEVGQKVKKVRLDKLHLEQGTCPTCSQQWSSSEALMKIAAYQKTIDKLIDQAKQYREGINREDDLNKKLEKLTKNLENIGYQPDGIDTINQKIEDIKAKSSQQDVEYLTKLNSYNSKIKEIENKYEGKINDLKNKENRLNQCLIQAKADHSSYKKAMNSYEMELSILNKSILDKQTALDNLKQRAIESSDKINIAKEAKRLVKSYTLKVFQETLDLIGETATDILSKVPNTDEISIFFEGCKENKSGVIKDEVGAIVNIGGDNKIPIRSFCGGERTSIDLAVDLAVIDIIESRTGKGADFFILDEPFDGLDSICKESYLELLKQIDMNKKIIIVSHSTELKEMVSEVIKVVKNKENSAIIA